MLNKQQKKQLVEELSDKLKRQNILIFTDFRGLKVDEMQELREKLREADGEYKVARKTLIKLALEKADKEMDMNQFEASLALTFGFSDPIIPTKIISKFSKEHKELGVLGGMMDDKVLSAEEIKELAKIPSQEELLAKLVGSIKSPISGFVNALKGNIRNLIGVLSAIDNK